MLDSAVQHCESAVSIHISSPSWIFLSPPSMYFLTIFTPPILKWVSLIAQFVKNLPAMQETLVQFLGLEDPLEKGKATCSSILGLSLWLSWWRIDLQCGRPGFNPWVGRSPGEGKGYPLQYSGLENSMDCIVHGVAKSQTQLSDFHFPSVSLILNFFHQCLIILDLVLGIILFDVIWYMNFILFLTYWF